MHKKRTTGKCCNGFGTWYQVRSTGLIANDGQRCFKNEIQCSTLHFLPNFDYDEMAYSLQTTERKNYKEITNVQILQGKRGLQKPEKDQLYPKEIAERDDDQGQVKVHY